MDKNANVAQNKKRIENVVLMKELSSNEFYAYENKEPKRVLENINLHIKRSQVWGISGKSMFETKLLLEIIANIKPYYSGMCVLVERGMMRTKRIILPHVFYIGTSEMIYNNMNVLEFLMFATAKTGINEVIRQDQIFESLIRIGLDYISLSPINLLTKEEKAVIALIVAAYSKSMLIVYNFPTYKYNEVLTGAILKIADYIKRNGRTLVLSTHDCGFIQQICTHAAFLADGSIVYDGTVDNFRFTYDKVAFYIEDDNIAEISAKLIGLLPQYDLKTEGKDKLVISNYKDDQSDAKMLYKKIIESGITPEKIKINTKTVENAYEEIMRQYDIQKQLL